MTLKLAETLNLRGDLTRKITMLKKRLRAVCSVQEGTTPADSAEDLIAEIFEVIERVHALEVVVHHANIALRMTDGSICMEVLAQREQLRAKRGVLTDAIDLANPERSYYSNREIRFLPGLDVKTVSKRADALAAEIHRLNTRIQQHNWATEVTVD